MKISKDEFDPHANGYKQEKTLQPKCNNYASIFWHAIC
jgi:hypothetical protein